ncbi:MAG TPA: DNA alkylation repair protein [Bauldia sp.]|nr:DNA alkylation repair protein [Bauldia sp.]
MPAARPPSIDAEAVIAELRGMGSEANRAGMARFGIKTDRAFGVSMEAQRPLARRYRGDHRLAQALWASGWHEARILAALIDDPQQVTRRQMNRWAADFDSWDVCDQACMKLFARTPFVADRVARWARDRREFVRRAAFATIAGYTVTAKTAPDPEFLAFLPLIEAAADDRRNFVKKAVNWALRQIGKRSPSLHRPALMLARRLAASDDPAARWIGKDAVRELTDPAQLARIARRSR